MNMLEGRVLETTRKAIKKNLYPASHAAIEDWDKLPWHRRDGEIQAYKVQSSQALAIDVFGTIKVSEERDRVLGALAQHCSMPGDGPWKVKLEWSDPDNLLNEVTPTQVDVIAVGERALLLFECKFTESGGPCSQTVRKPKHPEPQCDGNYALQGEPVDGVRSRCVLTHKGIRYWDSIPRIFGVSADEDRRPCPFRGDAFQWMRNVVLADRLATSTGRAAAVVAAYADDDAFPTARKSRSGGLGHVGASGKRLVIPISYQFIVSLAASLSDEPTQWNDLATWIEEKIRTVAGERVTR